MTFISKSTSKLDGAGWILVGVVEMGWWVVVDAWSCRIRRLRCAAVRQSRLRHP
jgi:hypothetical protein